MSCSSSTLMPVPTATPRPLEELEALRAELERLPGGQELAARIPGISEAVNRYQQEQEGMAEELLSVYEQLGAVFEITRRLPEVFDELKVRELFTERLARSFAGRRVSMWRLRPDGDWRITGEAPELTPWISDLIEESRAQMRVLVQPVPPGALEEAAAEVMVGPVFAGEEFVSAVVLLRTEQVPEFRACDMNLLEALMAFCGDLISNQRLVKELRETSIAMVCGLVTVVDQKDEYTSGHSVRVGYFAVLLGRELDLTEAELQMLEWGALLHDIGKIGIRDDVLKKRGKLTDEEFAHMKEHPVRSFRVVRSVPQLAQALDGVLHHHEHYNGSGYPDGLAGEDIPLQARIIQIADIFDALTSTRSYRKAFDWRKALSILEEEAGTTVDPRLQQIFDGLIRSHLEADPHAWEALVERAERFTGRDVHSVSFEERES